MMGALKTNKKNMVAVPSLAQKPEQVKSPALKLKPVSEEHSGLDLPISLSKSLHFRACL